MLCNEVTPSETKNDELGEALAVPVTVSVQFMNGHDPPGPIAQTGSGTGLLQVADVMVALMKPAPGVGVGPGGVVGGGAVGGGGGAVGGGVTLRSADHVPRVSGALTGPQRQRPLALDCRAPPGKNGPVHVHSPVGPCVTNSPCPSNPPKLNVPTPGLGCVTVTALFMIENSSVPVDSPMNVPLHDPLNSAMVGGGAAPSRMVAVDGSAVGA